MSTVGDTMSPNEVKGQLSRVVNDVRRTHRRVVVTNDGKPAVVLISLDDLRPSKQLWRSSATRWPSANRESRDRPEQAETLTKDEALARWSKQWPGLSSGVPARVGTWTNSPNGSRR